MVKSCGRKKYINEYHISSILVFPLLLSSFFDNREEMDYGRFPRDVLPDPGSQRSAEDGTIPGAHPAFFRAQPTYEDGFQGQASKQPTTQYPPEYPPPRAASSLEIYYPEDEANRRVSHAAGRSIVRCCGR